MQKAKHLKNAEKLIKDLQKDLDESESIEIQSYLRATIVRANVILTRLEKLPDPPPKRKPPPKKEE